MPSKVYKIFYDPQLQTVMMDWDGYSTSQQLYLGSEEALKLIAKHNAPKLLADLKDMVLLSREDQNWIVNSFIPRAMTAGLEFLAIVQPISYFNKIAVDALSFKANERNLSCKILQNLELSKQWLENPNEQNSGTLKT
ncbi:MAG TPA: hypothetical protein VLZ28_06790 [Daejeonella sp.]|nr:hypothetical protein [Daejeonella sp.]